MAFALGAWVLWCGATLHTSARIQLEAAPPIPTTLSRGRIALVLGAVLSGPAVLGIQSARGVDIVLPQFVVGHMVLLGLAVAYLVRLIEERARVEHLALHDDLTGLPNRVLFSDRVAAALAHAQRSGQNVALLFLDLDRFKTINDSLGHASGNDLLRLVGRRLRQCVRDEDTVARLSGDEFALLLPEVGGASTAGLVAEKILTRFADPFLVAKRELFVSPSIGIALSPSDGDEVTSLLKNADTAMYRAKERGRNNYQLYTADMNVRAHERLALETSLHTAISRDELVLHYQPKVDLRTGRIVGMEALVRWQHPQRGLLSPASFIPLAEETGLIVPLGEWVLETACEQTQRWHEAGYESLTVAVNFSARQFVQQRVENLVARKLRDSGLDAQALELELTESLTMQDADAIRTTLGDLQRMGVRCSIDDFGTGYSGLSHLTRLPIDRLKIDKCFVHEIARGDDDARIVAAVIALAHNLRLGVTAEGVETTEQLDFLREHGCDEMQGFLFSRPVPAAQFEELLQLERVSPDQRPSSRQRLAALRAVS
jgi:diguanylate cyclase (GGDEF)-like protein